MTEYNPSGALYRVDESKRKSEKSPNYTGPLELSREVVLDLYNQITANNTADRAKCQLVGWQKVSKKGTNFLSLVANVFEEQKQNKPPQQQPPQEQQQPPQEQQQTLTQEEDAKIPF